MMAATMRLAGGSRVQRSVVDFFPCSRTKPQAALSLTSTWERELRVLNPYCAGADGIQVTHQYRWDMVQWL